MTQDVQSALTQANAMRSSFRRLFALSSPSLILFAAAAFRVAELFAFEGTINDGTTRVALAAAWIFRGHPVFGRTDWPIGNYILPAIALSFWNNPYWSVRILYAIVCLSNVLLTYALGKELHGRTAGAIAAWIVAVMPLHILISANGAMSEGPYITFILLALLAAVRYSVTPAAWLAAVAGISITLAAMFRFDGVVWGLPIAVSLILFAWQRGISLTKCASHLCLLAVCGLAFPLALLLKWMALYHDPFHTFHRAASNTLQFFASGSDGRWPPWLYQSYVVTFWPASTFVLLTPLIAALGWIGVIKVIRDRRFAAAPLILGGLIVSGFLAFAALRHQILAQWRYALILVIVLSTFCSSGVELISETWKRLTRAQIWTSAIAVALCSQAVVTFFAYSDHGVFTRQLGMLSPLQPHQYASRGLIGWIQSLKDDTGCLVLTPHVLEQPYLDAHLHELEQKHKILAQSYYRRRSELVFSRPALVSELHRDISTCQYVVTSTSFRELGLQDGVFRELVRPAESNDGAYVWEGIHLQFEHRYGSNVVWDIKLPGS